VHDSVQSTTSDADKAKAIQEFQEALNAMKMQELASQSSGSSASSASSTSSTSSVSFATPIAVETVPGYLEIIKPFQQNKNGQRYNKREPNGKKDNKGGGRQYQKKENTSQSVLNLPVDGGPVQNNESKGHQKSMAYQHKNYKVDPCSPYILTGIVVIGIISTFALLKHYI
jgi:hypothetical protein